MLSVMLAAAAVGAGPSAPPRQISYHEAKVATSLVVSQIADLLDDRPPRIGCWRRDRRRMRCLVAMLGKHPMGWQITVRQSHGDFWVSGFPVPVPELHAHQRGHVIGFLDYVGDLSGHS